MKHACCWILAAGLLACSNYSYAQSQEPQTRAQKRAKARAFIDSVLSVRYFKSSYDTNYVVRPEGRLMLKARVNLSGDDFHVRGEQEGFKAKADLTTKHKTTLSIAASYRGITAAMAFNPAKIKGTYKDYELNLVYYSSRLSLDASYHRSTTLSGDIRKGDVYGHMEPGELKVKMANIAGYYIFNHRRFSYAAAYSQSYIQRRSAGSWLAGISYQGGSVVTTDELKERKPDANDIYIHLGLLGIGGGYAYNWVLGKRWLINLSMLPTFVVYNHNYMTVNDERRNAQNVRFSMIFNERVAIVCNISPRYFAGTTLTMGNTLFDNDLIINQNKWRLRTFIGMRL